MITWHSLSSHWNHNLKISFDKIYFHTYNTQLTFFYKQDVCMCCSSTGNWLGNIVFKLRPSMNWILAFGFEFMGSRVMLAIGIKVSLPPEELKWLRTAKRTWGSAWWVKLIIYVLSTNVTTIQLTWWKLILECYKPFCTSKSVVKLDTSLCTVEEGSRHVSNTIQVIAAWHYCNTPNQPVTL